ncbi:glycosyltransferase family 9 protein [Nitrospira moscoviensis]|uniref:Putative Glycosyl transferase, family 9 n=1 Tax=Nitrospira moscoviensis TaxID=42253 RepID=A0A0K2GGE7_NITMO|nr:glycosyltransferase family 9 protein [Nitrospira moscoviensis]ALA60030.1 putative Glycosyl transferase, family 9 [Nitrospira moscoviensis]
MKSDHSRAVLIIHPGALGDLLLSLPAISSLRTRYSDHQLVLLARADIGGLLHACGVVDGCRNIDSDDLASLLAGPDQVTAPLRELLGNCVHVVAWLRDAEGALQATLRECGVERISIGAATPHSGVHQSRRFLEVLGENGADPKSPFQLILPRAIQEAAFTYLQQRGLERGQRYIVCHPGSGSSHKCVASDTMALVIERLSEQGCLPVIVGGPADQATVLRLVARLSARLPVIQGQSLSTIAGVLAGARLFVGHDSGLTHLAAALGIPTVAIFGPTDPAQWAPLGAHVSAITGAPCSCRTWEQVCRCSAKPCLSVSANTIGVTCSALLGRYRSVTKS